MPVMPVRSRLRDYTLRFHPDFSTFPEITSLPGALFVVDANVLRLHADVFAKIDPSRLVPCEAIEDRKNLEGVQALYDALLARGIKRNTPLVSVGGGIVQDLTGFVASTLLRGLRWVFLPTTLLAQADSCLGAKTSLNYGARKNILGTFYPPHEVHLFTPFLATLTDADFMSGVGEIVKLHLMEDDTLADALIARMPALLGRESEATYAAVLRALEVKKVFVEEDEFDQGRRNFLNYGHCFGHALEAVSHFAVPHGQAVVAGMLLANEVAHARGLLADPTLGGRDETLLWKSLVVRPDASHLAPGPLADAMASDKKRTGAGLALIMKTDAGYVKVDDVTREEVAAAVTKLAQRLAC